MVSKDKEFKKVFEGKTYIFKIDPECLTCISDDKAFKLKDKNYAEIKSHLMKNKIEKEITNVKPGNKDELIIHFKKEDIYYEINLYEKPNENPKKKEIKSNGKIYIKELLYDNIYISFTENGITRKFTQDNSDKENIEKTFENFGEGCDITLDNNKLIIKSICSFVMKKDYDKYIDYYLSMSDNIEEYIKRNEKLIKEIKSKQKMIEGQSEAIKKNLRIMDLNADTIHFPKKRSQIQKENGISMDTKIITKKKDFDLIDNRLYQAFDKDVEYKLIYRASEVGDTAKIFKEKCREKNTLIIVQTDDDNKFGGFTTIPWDDSDKNKDDEKAFCFSVNKNKIYELRRYCSAIGCDKNSGPRFCYMFMINNRFMTKGGVVYPQNISHYNGQKEDYELNNGKAMFCVNELEVFKIKPGI